MTRMEFDVATHMVMMEPVRAGTLICVPVTNNIHTMPHNAAGSAAMIMKGSSQD